MALRVDDVDLGRDRMLVERYQAGDDAAFDDLYSRYFRRLHRYCARRVHDFDTAEEIAQEAFVRALQALPRLEGDRRFYPWMTVIASRLCVDHHRRCQRTEPSDEVDPGPVDADLDHVFTAVDHAHLATALGRINSRHRRVLELREREGLSYEAIAERMEVTLGTVEALLHRARKALRREFLALTDEPRRLAGIPLLGGLARVIDRARARIPELASLSQPVALGVASMALVIAPSVMTDDSPGSAPPDQQVSAVLGSAPASNQAWSGLRGLEPSGHERLSATNDHQARPVDADDTRTSAPVATVNAPHVAVGDEEGRHQVERQPVNDGLGPVLVGTDPAKAVNETTEEIADLLELRR